MIRASLLGCVGMFALVSKGIGYSGPTTCHWIIWPTTCLRINDNSVAFQLADNFAAMVDVEVRKSKFYLRLLQEAIT